MTFVQSAPELGNQYDDDRVLRGILREMLPREMLREIEPSLCEMGALAGGELHALQLEDRGSEPTLTRWSPWGERIDRIELTRLWRVAERVAAERGVVSVAYERAHGALSRVHQFALAYLFMPSTDFYACPLAMTDGAARTLLDSGNRALIERAVPHLTSREPTAFWTSGQWMTEPAGGSDVGRSETVAREEDGRWRLYGTKWFTSAATSQVALTLARPEGNPPGGKGLALFYVETRDADGRLRGIRIRRLKDKLGTRKLPTAELDLEGTPAELVAGTTGGVRAIAPMLNLTRAWNAISSVALMRRGLALARDYATRRVAFGAPLSALPLHQDTLAGAQAEFEGAAHLAFRVAGLIGRAEAEGLGEADARLLRVLTPLAKLTTGRQAVTVASECLEAFGGAGYVEDTGLPVLLRDAQVLPIWEGTTNVLSLDVLRALGGPERIDVLSDEVERCAAGVRHPQLLPPLETAREAVRRAAGWWEEEGEGEGGHAEAGARRFALSLGRAIQLALLCRHAQWALDQEHDPRPTAAARRLAAGGIDQVRTLDPADARLLASDETPG